MKTRDREGSLQCLAADGYHIVKMSVVGGTDMALFGKEYKAIVKPYR